MRNILNMQKALLAAVGGLALVALTPTCGHAADLGAAGGGYKDGSSLPGMPGVTWSGFYVEGGLGHSSTDHDVKGRTDDSTAKFLKDDVTYLTKDVYSYVSTKGHKQGDSCTSATDGTHCVTVDGTSAWDNNIADTISYTTDKSNAGTAYTILPAGSVLPTGATITGTDSSGATVTAGTKDKFPNGDNAKFGDALLANGGSNVGYTLDTSSLLSSDGTGKGIVGYVGLGYDRQFGNFIAGIKGDYQFRNSKTSVLGADIEQSDAFFLGTRVGALIADRFMLYGLVGYTWLNHANFADNLRASDHSRQGTEATYGDGSFGGFTFGGGVETRIMPNLYLGLEARFTQYGKETIYTSNYVNGTEHSSTHTSVTDEPSERFIGVNLKYKFGN
jgi:opacity protein-like surface antigen